MSRFSLFDLWAMILSLLVGAMLALDPALGLVAFVGLMGLFALTAPSGLWVFGALVSAVLLRGLISLGFLPDLMTFVDIPLAWGALLVALIRGGLTQPLGRKLTILLAWLAVAMVIAWVFHPAEVLRPLLYMLLLGEPFAIIAALLLDPPSARMRKGLMRLVIFVIAIQIPIGYMQYMAFGTGGGIGDLDNVQGTLFGAGAGHLSMAAIVILGVIWLLSGRRAQLLGRALLALPMIVLVFLADAKQVLFALPAIFVAVRLRGRWGAFLLQISTVVTVLIVLVSVYPAGRAALLFIGTVSENRGGKIAVVDLLIEETRKDPTIAVVGLGPAQTVSRASFMTTELYLREDSPIRALGLAPSRFAIEANDRVEATRTGPSSFNSAVSSALGVIGDLGLAGATVYFTMLVLLIRNLRKVDTPMAYAATAGWGMFALLGVVFAWWEEPPFAVTLAVVTGLALLPRSEEPEALT